MQIIHPGEGRDHIPTAIVGCDCCHASIEFNGLDVWIAGHGSRFLECPQCGNSVGPVRSLPYPAHLRPRGRLRHIWDVAIGVIERIARRFPITPAGSRAPPTEKGASMSDDRQREAQEAVGRWLAIKRVVETMTRLLDESRGEASDKLRAFPHGIELDGRRYAAIPASRGIHVGLAPWQARQESDHVTDREKGTKR
jgi:hypothetical protein